MSKLKINGTTPQGRAETMDFILEKLTDTLINLKDRWLEESKYEDFSEYRKIVANSLQKICRDITLVGMTKGFKITLEIPTFPYRPIISVTSRSIGWSSK